MRSTTPQRRPRHTKWTVTRETLQELKISVCRSSIFHRYPSRFPGILSWNVLFFFLIQSSKNTYQMQVNHVNHNSYITQGSSAYACFHVTQDLMEFLNANSSECSVVLFFTSWCQFSARLAPHFNALPRVFPSIHFLALDASQHSRWMVSLWPLC